MQTMPSKTRATFVVGIAALVLVGGIIAFAMNRAKTDVGEPDPMSQLAEPPNGAATGTDPLSTAPGSTSGSTEVKTGGMTNPANGATTGMGSNTDLSAAGEATQALTTLGPIPETHVVQPNETLYDISEKYYKTHIYAGDIESLNQLENPNMITAGLELKLPRPSDLAGGAN